MDICFQPKCGSLGSLCLMACIKVPNDLLDEIKQSILAVKAQQSYFKNA